MWIVNSGLSVQDNGFTADPPGANPDDKGGSTGYKWLILPLPHAPRAATWQVEQAVFSSFLRVGAKVNIPLQLNFSALAPESGFIQIDRGTPMLQYVPAVLPGLTLLELPLPDGVIAHYTDELASSAQQGGSKRDSKLGGVLSGLDQGDQWFGGKSRSLQDTGATPAKGLPLRFADADVHGEL